MKKGIELILASVNTKCEKTNYSYDKLTPLPDAADVFVSGKLGSETGCVLGNSDVVFEKFSSGYMHYLHFYFNNIYMTTEYMIGINIEEDSFSKKAEKVISEIHA